MILLRGLQNPGMTAAGCVATIGNFDGVHRGHQAILQTLKKRAQRLNIPSLVVLFEPQAQEFFRPESAPPRLMTFRQKFETLKELGLDAVFCLKFNDTLRNLSAASFVDEVLSRHLHLKHLVVGDDFRFGGDRRGDFDFLVNAGQSAGFTVENTATQFEGTERISSTHIREALSEGHFDRAALMLGRPYNISGRVMHGQALGRTLGFPTANIALKRKHCALSGVYGVKLTIEGAGTHCGVANVGKKPSAGQFKPNLEVHLLDYSGDLYGKKVHVEFVNKLRDEQKFEGLDQLTQQITKDVQSARSYFNLAD